MSESKFSKFNGEARDYGKWKEIFYGELRAKGILHVISDTDKTPIKPNGSYIFMMEYNNILVTNQIAALAGPTPGPNPGDPAVPVVTLPLPPVNEVSLHNTIINNYEVKSRLYEIEIESAIGILHKTIGDKLKAKFHHILFNTNLSQKQIVKQIYDGINQLFIKDTIHLVSNIENEMQTLPNASNHKEAVVLLDNMQRINNDLSLIKRVSTDEEINLHRLMVLEARSLNLPVPILHEKNCRMDDVALRKILFKKLIGKEFFSLNQYIELHHQMPWEEIEELIRNTCNRCEYSEDSSSKSANNNSSSTSINYTNTNKASSSSNDSKPNGIKNGVWTSNEPFGTFSRPCWNCKLFGHKTEHCMVPFCRKCNDSWNNVRHIGYHKSGNCSLRSSNNQNNTNQKDVKEDSNKKRKFDDIKQPIMMVASTSAESKDGNPTKWNDYLAASAVEFDINNL